MEGTKKVTNTPDPTAETNDSTPLADPSNSGAADLNPATDADATPTPPSTLAANTAPATDNESAGRDTDASAQSTDDTAPHDDNGTPSGTPSGTPEDRVNSASDSTPYASEQQSNDDAGTVGDDTNVDATAAGEEGSI